MHGEPYSLETLSRLITPGRMHGKSVKFTRLPVSWPEPEAPPATLIHLHKTRPSKLASWSDSLSLRQAELRAGQFLEECSYALLWLCVLVSLWCCFF